jgi:large subunit ribosomal protein L10
LAVSHEKKGQLLAGYQTKITKAQLMIWANYKGLKVSQIQDLRKRLRASGAEAAVVKNTLLRKALESEHMAYDHAMMSGPVVVTFVHGDIPGAIKTLNDFARERDVAFVLKGGMLSGRVISLEQVKALVNLPSREVLLGRVVGGIQAPLSGFVGVLASLLRGLPNVLNARIKQLEGSAS